VTVRVAIVGCGTIARRSHLKGLRSAGAEIVAFASRSRHSAEETARAFGGGEVVDDWHELLGRDDIDAFDVCTPNASHAEISIAAALAGKHVLVEKPMACTLEEADRMVEAASGAGTVLMPAHNSRFLGPFVAMKTAVARGDAGEVRAFRCAWGHGGPEGWAPAARWFRDRTEAGGGALIDLGVHAADVLRCVLADEPVAVSALLAPEDPGAPGAGGEAVEDLAQLVVRFAQGSIGSLQASWAVASGSDHQLTIQGTAATIHLDGRTPPTLFPSGGGDPVRLALPEANPGVFDAFVDAIDGATAPVPSAADGRAAVALVTAAYRSAASGRLEPVDPGPRGR
jgi:UDP-N-acetylglucosamine 3-dehydrogenase